MSLNFSESDTIHALGNEVAFGVMADFLFSVSFLPASLVLLPQRIKKTAAQTIQNNWADRLSSFVSQFRYSILVLSIIAIAGLGVGVSHNAVNDIIPHYFAKSLPWRQANDFAEEQFGGALASGDPLWGRLAWVWRWYRA